MNKNQEKKHQNKVAILIIVLGLLLIPCTLRLIWAVANNNIFWLLLSVLFIVGTACIYMAIGIIGLK